MAAIDLETEVDPFKNSYSEYDDLKDYLNNIRKSVLKEISIVHLNLRSLRKNWVLLKSILENNLVDDLDVIVLSEISIYEYENNLYNLKEFNSLFFNRKDQKGGGICMYIRDTYEFNKVNVGKNDISGHEIVHVELVLTSKIVDVIAVYRPPDFSIRDFIRELDSILKQINQHHDIILIGDINIDLFKSEDIQVTNYQNVLSEYGLFRTIYGITREAVKNGILEISCIDHIFVRTCKLLLSAVIHTHVADHYMVGLSLYINNNLTILDSLTSVKANITNRKLKYDEVAIARDLKNINWKDKIRIFDLHPGNTNIVYNGIKEEFVKIYDTNTAVINIKERKRIDKTWITAEIRNEIGRRDKAFKTWKATPTNMRYRNDYKTLRNAVNLKIRNRKNEFYSNAIEEVRGNLKKTWIKINQIIGRKNKGNRDELIIKHFSAQYSITEMLKGFADEYSNGVKNVIQECSIRLDIQENICSDRSIFIPNAREIDVVNIIHKMSIKKAPGTDKIRLVDVKKCDNMLIELITKFINLSLNEGVIPNELKIAIIKPIYKQGPRNMFGNYRPIAILSTMEKILEHYISKHVTRYIVSNNIICSNQYGFQKGMSTTILLKDFANLINGKLNSNKVIMALFIDFTKAFDTIRHDLLLKSLELIGIRGKLLMWFTNYLKNRLIKISVGNEYSKEYVVEQGVPQGSILGPTLYNLYVNSVFTRVLSSDVFMFADDMAMLSTHFNEDIARNNLQDDYNRILVWAHDRGLKVNEQKTKLLVITTSKKKHSWS